MENKTDIHEVVGALKYLEMKYGRTPSVQEVADYIEVSSATVWRYLKQAAEQKIITERDGKYMTNSVAEAYKQEEK